MSKRSRNTSDECLTKIWSLCSLDQDGGLSSGCAELELANSESDEILVMNVQQKFGLYGL